MEIIDLRKLSRELTISKFEEFLAYKKTSGMAFHSTNNNFENHIDQNGFSPEFHKTAMNKLKELHSLYKEIGYDSGMLSQ